MICWSAVDQDVKHSLPTCCRLLCVDWRPVTVMLLVRTALDAGVLARSAAAETICAEDMAAMLWTTHSRVPWSYQSTITCTPSVMLTNQCQPTCVLLTPKPPILIQLLCDFCFEICKRPMQFISTCLQHGCSLHFLCGTVFYLHLVSHYLVEIWVCVQLGISLN